LEPGAEAIAEARRAHAELRATGDAASADLREMEVWLATHE
jgi:hypothetical protein